MTASPVMAASRSRGALLGIAGWSGSGKTALIVRLIPELAARGVRVATVKHAHHDFDIDTPGKDSHAHRMAGAVEVAVTSAKRWAIVHENAPGEGEPSLDRIVARMSPADLYLIEGFKSGPHPKIEVHRAVTEAAPMCRANPSIVAVASDAPGAMAKAIADMPGTPPSVLDLNDAGAVADFIVGFCGLGKPGNSGKPAEPAEPEGSEGPEARADRLRGAV